MPERTTITEATQVGVEATPGTGVAANRRLRAIGYMFDPEFESNSFRPSGNKFPTIVAPGKEWIGGSIEGAADYNEIIYPLAQILGSPVTTTPGGGTTARQHVFTVAPSATQDPKTLTVEKGSSVRAGRSVYVAATALGMTFNRDEVTVEGDIIGRRLEDGVTLTGSPTTNALQPILPQHVSVYLDPTFAGIGTTKLLRVLEAGWNLSDRFGALWPLDSAQTSFVTLYEVEPGAEATLTQVADAAGMAQLTAARAGTTQFLRLVATGPIIEAAIPYSLTVDLPVKVTDFSEGDTDGLKTIEWTYDWVDDSTAANAGKITVVNVLTGL